jgi:MFS family permease
MVLPLLANRVREWAVLCAAMLVTGLVFGVYPLTTTALAMGVCSVLLGLTLGMVQPMVMSLLHQLTPEARHGEALGLRLMAINASSVLMPLLFGTAGAIVGVAGVFWIVGAAVGSGARTAWLLKDSLSAHPQGPKGPNGPYQP